MTMDKKVFTDKEKLLTEQLNQTDNEINLINAQIGELQNKLNELHAGRHELLGALANTQEFIKLFNDGK